MPTAWPEKAVLTLMVWHPKQMRPHLCFGVSQPTTSLPLPFGV